MDIEGFANELVVRIKGTPKIKGKFDNFIIIDSGSVKGTGKTVFSIKLSKVICKIIGYDYHKTATSEKPFTFDLIAFNPTSEMIIDWVKTLPEACPIHIDEITKVGYKRDFQKEYQKKLIKFIKICRKFGKIIIGNDPDFWDIDKDLRNLCDFRVIIVKRGLAQVKGKSGNPDEKDKWLRDISLEKINMETHNNPLDLEGVRRGIRKTPCYLYDIPFGDMDKEEYGAYEELSKEEEVKGFLEGVEMIERRELILGILLLKIKQKALEEPLTTLKLCLEGNKLYKDSFWFKNEEKLPFYENYFSNLKRRAKVHNLLV